MRRCRRFAALRMVALTAMASVLTAGATSLPGAARHSEIAGQGLFNAVSCTAVRQCMAVGLRFTPAGYNTLAEQWTPAGWRVLATPNDPGTTDSALFAVACESAAGCMAVGYSGPGNTQHTRMTSSQRL